jgi:hypothetical protein
MARRSRAPRHGEVGLIRHVGSGCALERRSPRCGKVPVERRVRPARTNANLPPGLLKPFRHAPSSFAVAADHAFRITGRSRASARSRRRRARSRDRQRCARHALRCLLTGSPPKARPHASAAGGCSAHRTLHSGRPAPPNLEAARDSHAGTIGDRDPIPNQMQPKNCRLSVESESENEDRCGVIVNRAVVRSWIVPVWSVVSVTAIAPPAMVGMPAVFPVMMVVVPPSIAGLRLSSQHRERRNANCRDDLQKP